ncbi:phage holin family protein [Syntrophomonas curvata]
MDWTQLKTAVGLMSAVVTGAIAQVLGGWDMWLQALVLFVVLDYITGLMAAAIEKKLRSEVGFRGVMKKVFIFCLVAVAFQADMLLGTEIIRVAVIGFYLGTEGLSILENAGRAGLPLPEALRNALIQVKGSGKKVGA